MHFIAIADAGWRRHTKVSKAGVVAWYGELPPGILPRPSSAAPAGDKPPHYIPLTPTPGFRPRIRVRGRLFAEFTVALGRPHKWLKIE